LFTQFAFYSVLCKNAFEKVALTKDPTDKARLLDDATIFFRATTSNLWISTNMTPELYNTVVRPSMISDRSKTGFTGNDNCDWMNMIRAKNRLFYEFIENKILSVNESLIKASNDFFEAYITDGISHRQLIAHMVGSACSLLGDAIKKNYHEAQESAVIMFEKIIEARRKEVETIKNALLLQIR
jgi:hypothetical protein